MSWTRSGLAVVLAKSELVDKLGVVCFPSNPLRAPIVRPFDRSLRFFSESCSVAARDPRASPSTGRSAAVREATEADRFGPAPLGMVVFHLAGLAVSGNPGQTRDSHRLAPAGIPPLLEVEIPLCPSRSSQRSGRNTPADSPDEPRKPALGSAAHPRAIAAFFVTRANLRKGSAGEKRRDPAH